MISYGAAKRTMCLLVLLSVMALTAQATAGTCGSDTKIRVTETVWPDQEQIEDMVWLPSLTGMMVVLTRTSAGGLFRSEDDGETWVDQLPLMSSSPKTVKQVYVFPNKDEHVVAIGTDTKIWTSVSRGKAWVTVDTGLYITALVPSPYKASNMLAVSQSESCHNGNFYDCFKRLVHYTTDYGSTWTKVTDRASLYMSPQWGFNDRILVATADQTGSGTSLVYYDNFNVASPTVMVTGLEGFVVTKTDYLFAAQRANGASGGLSLLFSPERGGKPLVKARFPGTLQGSYTILDVSSDVMFISVLHTDMQWGNIYVSSALSEVYNGTLDFYLSLANVKRAPTGHVDFQKFKGLDGIFIANMVPDEKEPNELVSVISYDKGGWWQKLSAPEKRWDGSSYSCGDLCRLNLNGAHHRLSGSSHPELNGGTGPIWSKDNCIGLLLATGNVGSVLSLLPEDTFTYFSRDGGYTWNEVRRKSHNYDFADYGALTVMAVDTENTNAMDYSWDEGLNWASCNFTNLAAIRVRNILADPKATTDKFVIYGERDSTDVVVIHLDLTEVQPVTCQSSDYETWSPKDANGLDCIMGATDTYLRRKQTSACSNPDDFQSGRISSKPCPCTNDDYECDMCYIAEARDAGFVCMPDPACAASPPPSTPSPCVGTYTVSQRYRIVAGNKCTITEAGGVDLRPQVLPCPPAAVLPGPAPPTGLSGVGIAIIVICLLVAVLGGGAILWFTFLRKRWAMPSDFRAAPGTMGALVDDDLEGDRDAAADDDDEAEVLDDDAILSFTGDASGGEMKNPASA